MTDPLHVAPGIVGFLDAPNHLRIRAIRTERWIGFGRARRVVEHLSALCEYPPSTRPPGLAIYGHSGMGKTMLVEKLRRDHPPAFNSAVGFETSPVLAISLTSPPTERRVYAQLLMALGVSVNERATLLELEIKAIRLLKDSMVRVLVFDEVHNLLADSPREQRVILQLFRHLSNELKASLVCLGVADARDAIAGDVQLARRLDQLVLPRWKGDEEFQEMVTAILRSLPLKRPSVLSAQGFRHLVRMTELPRASLASLTNSPSTPSKPAPSAFQTPSSKPGSPQSKRRPLSPDSATKLALKLRLSDASVSISVPLLTQIGPVSGSSVNRHQ